MNLLRCWISRQGSSPIWIQGLHAALEEAQRLVREDPSKNTGVFVGFSSTSTWWHHGWQPGQYVSRLGPICDCEVCLDIHKEN